MDYEPDPYSVATKIAVDALSRRARSRGELAEILAKRGTPEDVAERLIDRLVTQKLVDDHAFAQEWSRLRHRSKGLSRRVLAQELRKKSIAPEVIDEVLGEISRDDEIIAARNLVAKKLRSLNCFDSEVQYRRLHSLLARKGYSSNIISEAIRLELAIAS
ncbi:MAG: regulatory protein RecX [Actinobacteria bacterium]|nr:regulatory protein RecX [Actinomycetota bacterium]